MKTYKIYNEKYELSNVSSEASDAYALNGQLVDDRPKGKFVGYVRMSDGSVIECFTKMNPLVVILPVVLVVLVIAVVFVYLMFLQPKDVTISNTPIKVGEDSNVVTYNGFMAIESGSISVDFTNGAEACTIQVVGDGITCDPVHVEPGEYVATIPATFETSEGVMPAKIVIITDTSEVSNDVVVEVPENNTPNSPDTGLEGYWKGETIYGTGTVE